MATDDELHEMYGCPPDGTPCKECESELKTLVALEILTMNDDSHIV